MSAQGPSPQAIGPVGAVVFARLLYYVVGVRKFAIVTGASRGIGSATAQLFHGQGWDVVGVSRTSVPGREFEHLALDLDVLSDVETVAATLSRRGQSADMICLVHNAFHHHHDDVGAVRLDALQRAWRIGVVAPSILNRHLVPLMNVGSSILYIGSTLAEKAVAGSASYCTVKHAVVGLMRATCQDLLHRRIHSCCVCPGFVATEMLTERCHDDPAALEQITSRVGYNRLIDPDEIARLVVYCAENPVVNGSVIHANLGQREW